MKTYQLLLALGFLLGCVSAGYGMATEQIGPDKDQRHPTVEQPGWPAGMIKMLGHDSRVYSIWVNGNENFYFKAAPDEIGQLIKLYSTTRLRDHIVIVKTGTQEVGTFKGNKIEYNVNLHYLGGIALAMTRRNATAETLNPHSRSTSMPTPTRPFRSSLPFRATSSSTAKLQVGRRTARRPNRIAGSGTRKWSSTTRNRPPTLRMACQPQ